MRLRALLLALLLVATTAAPALVGLVSAQVVVTPSALQPIPNGLNVSVLRPTAVNVKWVLSGVATGTRATSTIGLFIRTNPGTGAGIAAACTPGAAIGQINTTVTMAAAGNGVARAVETLVIPGIVAERALKEGLDVFFYCRVFGGGGVPAGSANVVTCKQGSSAYANFSIARVELFFENRRRVATVPLGTPNVKVFADVAYNGSGLLRAVWEVAELGSSGVTAGPVNAPPTTFTTPVDPNLIPPRHLFRTLHTITQYVGFGDRALLTMPQSPSLPTTQPGTYVVNLRFVEPAVGFEIPVATYFVKSNEDPVRRAEIALLTPAEAAVLPYALVSFQWHPVTGAAHYRLDVFPQESTIVQTAPGLIPGPASNPGNDSTVFNRAPADLSGDRPDATLTALVPPGSGAYTLRQNQIQRLVPGRSYGWQVRAFDGDGNVIGSSPVRQFVFARR